MSTHEKCRCHQQGGALIICMVMIIIIAGMTAAFFQLSLLSSVTSQHFIDYSKVLGALEKSVNETIVLVQETELETVGSEKICFVEQDLAPGFSDRRTTTMKYDGIVCEVAVRSAYLSWRAGENADGDYLLQLSANREDMNSARFDIYEITATNAPFGRHGLIRTIQAFFELRRMNVAIPAPLYIHNDDNPVFAGNAFHISGADHAMTAGGNVGEGECPDCAGTGTVDCTYCNGTGIRDNGQNCNKCNAIGVVSCGSCNGTGIAGASSSGQANQADYLIPGSTDWKPAVGYNGPNGDVSDFNNLVFQGGDPTQINTVDDMGNTHFGDDAFISTQIDLMAMASAFIGGTPDNLTPTKPDVYNAGSPNNATQISTKIGGKNDFKVTYVGPNANMNVSGQIEGGGVLVVDGDLDVTGQFTFYGIVIVLGDLKMSGGGAGVHIFGSCMVNQQSWVGGNANIWWSQDAIDKVMNELDPTIQIAAIHLGWRER